MMRSGVRVGLAVIIIFILAFFVVPRLTPANWASLVITLLFLAIMSLLVYRHARTTGYHCPACGHEYAVSAWVDFLSPHGFGRKLLRCPRCRLASWCNEIDRTAISPATETEVPVPDVPPAGPGWLYFQVAVVVALYALLWGFTLYRWPAFADASSIGRILKIPLAAGILLVLHGIFCLFAARHGYKSRVYPAITVFIAAFILLALWMQWIVFSRMP